MAQKFPLQTIGRFSQFFQHSVRQKSTVWAVGEFRFLSYNRRRRKIRKSTCLQREFLCDIYKKYLTKWIVEVFYMWGFIIALISGALMSVQGVFNTQVTKSSSLWAANSWVQLTAFIVCILASNCCISCWVNNPASSNTRCSAAKQHTYNCSITKQTMPKAITFFTTAFPQSVK